MKGNITLKALVGLLAALLVVPTLAMAAAPQVVTVPWRGTLNLQHETFNGKQIHLKGVARGLVMGATAQWDPGDATGVINATVDPDGSGYDFDLGVTHTYPNSAAGTPFTATLTVCNPGNECSSKPYRVVVKDKTLDTEINVAIDEGLWYAHRTQVRNPVDPVDGGWFSQGDVSPTAGSVQAFQINNHFEGNDPTFDPYADTVARGLKYLFSRLGTYPVPYPGRQEPAGNPDSNGNGLGVAMKQVGFDYYDAPYELGQVMDAIVSTKTPNKLTTTGPLGTALDSTIANRTYKDIVQDMVDMYAAAQGRAGAWYRGGWRYYWTDYYSGADNSACQWAAIGILAARDLFGCTVPAWLYSENLIWLNYSQIGSPAYGYGYTGSGDGVATSPSGLIQAIMDGVQKTDANRWVGVEKHLADNWAGWYQGSNNEYALYAIAKAMRLALPSPIVLMAAGTSSQIDWFKADEPTKYGVARTILNAINADGQYTGGTWVSGALHHAWGVIILTGTLHLEPVAVAAANPNPGAAGVPIHFNGSGSYHTDPARSIVLYQWFFSDGANASGITTDHAFACASVPCNFTATLQVTNNNTPALVATNTINVKITAPPHPPTANAGGSYIACRNEQFTLDGSKSYDIDTAQFGDFITAYGWELNFAQPLDFADATGVKPATSFAVAGKKDIGLKVWDNSMALGAPENLIDTNFTTADIWDCSCFTTIAARAKPGKIDLTWTPVTGAASYDIYRSTTGPNSGFVRIAANYVSTYAVYADFGLVNGTQYWYRIAPHAAAGAQVCGGSMAATAKPMASR